MTTVLVPLEGTVDAEQALPVAQALARRLFSTLVVVRSDWDTSHAEAAAYLKGLADRFDLDLDVSARVIEHHPAESLPEVLEPLDDPLLCVASHGRTGFGHAVLGSISEEIIAASAVPVIAVGPKVSLEALDGERLGWCVDEATDIAAGAPFCAAWAARLGVGVDVLTVRPEDDRPVSRFHRARRDQLDLAVEELRRFGLPVKAHVLKELQPARRLAAFADEHGLALLIADKRSGTGVRRDVLGSTTMLFVHASPCPVLIPPHTK